MTMRFATTIGIVLGMLGTAPGPFARQSGAIDPAVRQGIQQTWDEVTVALRQKDAAALARAWAPDGDHGGLTPDTTIRNGRADIEAMWIAGLPGLPARDRKVTLRSVRLLRPDVALVDGTMESGPATGVNGLKLAGGREPFFAVMTKDGSRWLISATRMGASVLNAQ
jgi:uncharacterized protein (TIGR02246 family)